MESDPLTKGYFSSVKNSLVSLHYTHGEFYLTMAMEFFLKCSFNFAGYLLSIYYIEVWGLDDVTSGILVALNSCQIFLIFVMGGLVDYLGVKHSYIITSVIGLAIFITLVLIENLIVHAVLIVTGFSVIAMLTFTSVRKAIVLSTDLSNRSQGFSMFNVILYISTIMFGLFSELLFYLQGVTMDAFKSFFYLFIGFYALSLFLGIFVSKLTRNWTDEKKIYEKGPLEIMSEVFNEKRFWRLSAVLSISAIPIGTLYQSGFALPIYMERELGDTSNYGIIIAIFALLIIILSPILTPLVDYFTIYECLIIGTVILGIAPLIFVFGANFYTIITYVIITAIGGTIFECRVVDYSGYAGYPGREGIFFSLIAYTYSFGYIVTGIIGGIFLEKYCPEEGDKSCWVMWYWIAAVDGIGALLLIVFRRSLEQPLNPHESDPYIISSHMH